jgi:hypothetical protein
LITREYSKNAEGLMRRKLSDGESLTILVGELRLAEFSGRLFGFHPPDAIT